MFCNCMENETKVTSRYNGPQSMLEKDRNHGDSIFSRRGILIRYGMTIPAKLNTKI